MIYASIALQGDFFTSPPVKNISKNSERFTGCRGKFLHKFMMQLEKMIFFLVLHNQEIPLQVSLCLKIYFKTFWENYEV